MLHDYRALATRVYDIFTRGAVEEIPEVFAPDYVEHELLPGSTASGIEAVAEWVRMTSGGISDLSYRIDSVVGDGHQSVCRVQMTGTHSGDLMGVPATGNPIDIQIIDWVRVTPHGLIAEHWGASQDGLLMQQIGAYTAPPIDLTRPVVAPA